MNSSATDEALVARLADHDEAALRELHHRYAALVFTVAARFVGSSTAEEVVQDVFVTLWTKHASFDPARGAFKPWLVQIARRRSLNAVRGAKAEGSHDDAALGQLEADTLAPDEASWIAHRQAVIRAAVDALPEAQRKALSLAFFDELTHEQIARILGAPVGTIKTRIRSGLRRLAPVLIAVLAAVAVVLVVRRREERAARNEAALRMVTTSDVVTRRLGPGTAAPVEAHGNYRTRPGASVAVLTTSSLPQPAPGQSYAAWSHAPDGWHRLGIVVVESDGRSLLVGEIQPGADPPDRLQVTREANDTGAAPSGPVMLEWISP
ncbi:MAG TPA: sigma-70 family RNA polymerase sigma factor [Polyangiaceae bacterium]